MQYVITYKIHHDICMPNAHHNTMHEAQHNMMHNAHHNIMRQALHILTDAHKQGLATGEGSYWTMDLKGCSRSAHHGQHNQLVCDDVLNVCAREYALFSSKVNQ